MYVGRPHTLNESVRKTDTQASTQGGFSQMEKQRSFYGVDVVGEVFRFHSRGTANRVRRVVRRVAAVPQAGYAGDPEKMRRLVRFAAAQPHRRTKRILSDFVLYRKEVQS
jgi:hypothetical protein